MNFDLISNHNSTVLNLEHVFQGYYVIRKLNITKLSYLLLNVIFQIQSIIQRKKCMTYIINILYIINIYVVLLLVWIINRTKIQSSYIKIIKIFHNHLFPDVSLQGLFFLLFGGIHSCCLFKHFRYTLCQDTLLTSDKIACVH